MVFFLFLLREQIEKQRADAGILENAGDKLIAWTVAAAATAMSKKNEAFSVRWNGQLSFERHAAGGDLNFGYRHVRNIGFETPSAMEISE